MNDLRLALWQCEPARKGLAAALDGLDDAAAQAAAAGAALLITPEMYLTGYNIGVDAVRAAAQPRDGVMLRQVSTLANRHGVAILVGFPELGGEGRVHNAVALIVRSGELRSVYWKSHLYGAVDRAQFSAGDCLGRPFDFEGCVCALTICYDVEFPELVRAQALSGVEVLLVPTANMLPYTGVATRLVPARAEENAIFVAYANYVGNEGEFDYCGLSCVCGPDGVDLARAGGDEELLLADLSKQLLQDTRAHSTHLNDLRPELYRSVGEAGELP